MITKSVSVKSRGTDINLHNLIINSLNEQKPKPRKNYGFDEVFRLSIFLQFLFEYGKVVVINNNL